MMKFESKRKGFTLVELMIVLAVIALLIIVLLPRIGPIKNKSRETGIKTNMAMLEGIVMSNIDNFTATDDVYGIDGLEAKIAYDLTTVAVDNQKLKNPITGGIAVATDATENVPVAGTTTVAAYSADDDTATNLDAFNTACDAEWTATLTGAAGNIAYAAYVDTGKLYVKLIPYGVDSKRMTTLEKTLAQ